MDLGEVWTGRDRLRRFHPFSSQEMPWGRFMWGQSKENAGEPALGDITGVQIQICICQAFGVDMLHIGTVAKTITHREIVRLVQTQIYPPEFLQQSELCNIS